jgi:hypothetical protein
MIWRVRPAMRIADPIFPSYRQIAALGASRQGTCWFTEMPGLSRYIPLGWGVRSTLAEACSASIAADLLFLFAEYAGTIKAIPPLHKAQAKREVTADA